MYSLTSGQYIPTLHTVDNLLIRQLYVLGVKSSKEGKLLTIITKDFISNRGEVADKKLRLDEKSVLNVTKLSPLSHTEGVENLQQDIALYRLMSLGFNTITDYSSYIKDNKNSEFLMMDYFLSSSLCYVEVFEKNSSKVSKFFSTRNRFIAAQIAGIDSMDTSKYVNFLTPLDSDYRNKQLRALKLTQNKNGFRITQPKSTLDFENKVIRVMPLFLISAFLEGFSEVLKNNIVDIKYIKDNGTERSLTSTLSPKILLDYYEPEVAEKKLNNVEFNIDKGLIRIPELGGSKYDDTGVRALNLSRITSISYREIAEKRYIDVDFNTIIPYLKVTIEDITDINILNIIYQGLLNAVPSNTDMNIMKMQIFTYIDTQYGIFTTTFQERMHDFMTSYKMVFTTYTGKPVKYDVSGDFNLGVN